MYDVEKRSAVLEDAAGFAKQDAYMYGPVTKWRTLGNKLRGPLNAVQLRMPPVLVS